MLFNHLMNFIRTYWWQITLFTATAITCLSLYPANQLPTVPGTDKTHHFIAYALLILPTAMAKPKNLVLVIFSFVMLGGLIEIIQPYVNRYGEWLDFLANNAGLLLGFMLGSIANYFNKSNY